MSPPLTSLLVLGIAGLAAVPAPAGAANCFGLSNTRVCVTTHPENLPDVDPDGSSVEECVYLGGSSCTSVSVPVPGVTLGGRGDPIVEVTECYVLSAECFPPPD